MYTPAMDKFYAYQLFYFCEIFEFALSIYYIGTDFMSTSISICNKSYAGRQFTVAEVGAT